MEHIFGIKFWGTIIFLFTMGIIYLANKLTAGLTTGYIRYEMNKYIRRILMSIQGFGSLLLALLLPNNFLNKIDFIGQLYQEHGLWVLATMVILLTFFIMLFGTTFTFMMKIMGLRKFDEETVIDL